MKTEKPQLKIIYFRENYIESWLSDLGTFGFIIASFYLNHKYVGDNPFVSVLLLVMFVFFMIAKTKHKYTTYTDKQKLIEDLKSNKI